MRDNIADGMLVTKKAKMIDTKSKTSLRSISCRLSNIFRFPVDNGIGPEIQKKIIRYKFLKN